MIKGRSATFDTFVGLIFVFAIAVRVISLRSPFGDFDEGVYLAAVRSVSQGYPLFTKTYHSQGPLFIYLGELFYKLSPTLTSVRLLPVISSLVAMYVVYRLLYSYVGRFAALFAACYLAVDSYFVVVSRTFQVDMPWVAFSLVTYFYLLLFHERQRTRDLYVSALCLAISLFLKLNPLLIPMIVTYFLLFLHQYKYRIVRYGLYYVGAILLLLLLLIPPHELRLFYTHSIHVRTLYLQVSWPLLTNAARRSLVAHELWLIVVSIVSIFGMLYQYYGQHRPWRLWLKKNIFFVLSCVWLVATWVAFAIYNPLFPHHYVFFIVPSVLVAAPAVQFGFHWAKRKQLRFIFYLFVLFGILCYAAFQGRALVSLLHPQETTYDKTVRLAANLATKNTRARDRMITDEPLVLYLANRDTAPELVDPSWVRIQSGLLTSDEAITYTKKYRPAMVALVSGRFASLPAYVDYLHRHFHETNLGNGVALFTQTNPE